MELRSNGKLLQVDTNSAMPLLWVLRDVLDMTGTKYGCGAGFAVVGKSTWHGRQGALAIAVEWRQRPAGGLDSGRIDADLQAAARAGDGHVFHERGDVARAESDGRPVEAWYRAPYLAHGTMEPMNCTAQVRAMASRSGCQPRCRRWLARSPLGSRASRPNAPR